MYPADESKAFTSTPTVTFTVEQQSPAGAGPRQAAPFRPVIIADHLALGVASAAADQRIRIPDGTYSIVARIEADGKTVAVLNRPLYAISDFADRISKLNGAIDQIKKSSDPGVKAVAGLIATPEFQLRRISHLDRNSSDTNINVPAELDRLDSVLTALRNGENPFAAERGELERAYLSSEGQLVPYGVYVPASYDGSHPVPLVVALHGALGDEKSYLSGIYDPATIKGELEKHGYIMVTPRGPGLVGGYSGKAEADVTEVIEQALSAYKVDLSRIFLTGHSMGGFGAWQLASDHPEIIAAMAPVSGGSPVPPAQLPALLVKLKGMPIFVVHGAKDGIVAPEQSRKMVEAAKKAGLQVTYLEVPGADHLTVVGTTFGKILDFFGKNPKQGSAAEK